MSKHGALLPDEDYRWQMMIKDLVVDPGNAGSEYVAVYGASEEERRKMEVDIDSYDTYVKKRLMAPSEERGERPTPPPADEEVCTVRVSECNEAPDDTRCAQHFYVHNNEWYRCRRGGKTKDGKAGCRESSGTGRVHCKLEVCAGCPCHSLQYAACSFHPACRGTR